MTYTNGLTQTAAEPPALQAPDPEVRKNTRKRYTPKFKLGVLELVETMGPREAAAFFRKKGIYASMVSRWREEHRVASLSTSKAPAEEPLARKETLALQRRVLQLEKKLQKADAILEVQKKLLLLFDWPEERALSQ